MTTSETKFNPGPWRLDGTAVLDANGAVVCMLVDVNAYGDGMKTAENAADNGPMILAAKRLYEALYECRTDLMIAAGNADNAAKTDPRWEGVGERLRKRVQQADAALSSARVESA